MKTITTQVLIGLIVFLSACGGDKDSLKIMTEKRDSLKKVMAGVETEIAKLEEEIAKKDTSKKEKKKTVELLALVPQNFNNYIDIQGKVDADENVSVNAEMPGTVSKVNVQLGDQVSTGQVLAELDSKALQQGIAEIQNSLELANTLFEKQKNLWEQKIGTEVQFLGAKNQKESLEKRMASMQEQLRMSKIISPINGIVDAVDVKLGQATMPGLPAIRVVNMNSLKVKGEVAESYLSKVKSGNEVVVIFPDMMDTVRTKIAYVAKVISPLNRTFTATVNLDGKKEYHPNMIAIMKIIDYSNPKAFAVPVSTIQKAQEGDFIFIAENKKAKKVKVKTGRTYNGNTEILEGLKEGDQLISKGFQELNEGDIIKY
ncbi:MAG: efflux RND transporter periplasmic adaptor subunit [Bacteroidetes bacterium]|nr:MAG: efflux RND transporter periplasmic adaptor subunit [Bacteroidota bacterium]